MKVKPVFTWSPSERKVRLFRFIWEHGANIGKDPSHYSAMMSLSLVPRLFAREITWDGFDVTILGVRLHHKRSYGGRFV